MNFLFYFTKFHTECKCTGYVVLHINSVIIRFLYHFYTKIRCERMSYEKGNRLSFLLLVCRETQFRLNREKKRESKKKSGKISDFSLFPWFFLCITLEIFFLWFFFFPTPFLRVCENQARRSSCKPIESRIKRRHHEKIETLMNWTKVESKSEMEWDLSFASFASFV